VAKTIVICGYGSGISDAVARRFGSEGFSVALVARSATKLDAGVDALRAKGTAAAGFRTDLSDPTTLVPLVADIQKTLGPIGVLHWNVPPTGAGNLLSDPPLSLRAAFDVSVTSLVAAVQAARSDLREARTGSVLVTNGAGAVVDPKLDELAVEHHFMGGAIVNTAQHRMVGLLSRQLRAEGVYVGEVVVAGIVRGTGYDTGNAVLTSDEVAAKFWTIHRDRPEAHVAYLGVGLSGRGRP
jgi:NAD(P)-dependent dehydrogenase (short-subunit alcohol dehydrogenase family)